MTVCVVAVPAAYRDDLAPISITFALEATEGLDYTDVTGARAVVRRSDGVVLNWALDLVDGATETAMSVEHTLAPADLYDTEALPVAPGTYELRVLLTTETGEHIGPRAWLAVERL